VTRRREPVPVQPVVLRERVQQGCFVLIHTDVLPQRGDDRPPLPLRAEVEDTAPNPRGVGRCGGPGEVGTLSS
jgi:hypothetical protein